MGGDPLFPAGKSRFSVVVAFTFTCSKAASRSAAGFALMASIWGAIRGAWATEVASRLASRQPARAHQRPHPTQQQAAVDIGIGRVGIGKMATDITLCDRAQQRIADGVDQYVAVGWASRPWWWAMVTPPSTTWLPSVKRWTS